MDKMITADTIFHAEKKIRPHIFTTPLLTSDRLNFILPFDLYIKAECLQRTGSFKFRGATHAVACLNVPNQPVIAFSSGNHAQAVALAAHIFGRNATIIIPEDAPDSKITGARSYGAQIVLYDRYKQNREQIGRALATEQNAVLIPPYDDPYVIAGQGTAGIEIVRQVQDMHVEPDIFICCCGGGGLMAGTSIILHQAFPHIDLHSAEPENFDDMARSLASGQRQINNPQARSICDAIVTPSPGEMTFPLIHSLAHSGFAVTDIEALAAMHIAWAYFKLVLEPGGAVALASALQESFIDTRPRDARQSVVVMASGGNCDKDIFRQALATNSRFLTA